MPETMLFGIVECYNSVLKIKDCEECGSGTQWRLAGGGYIVCGTHKSGGKTCGNMRSLGAAEITKIATDLSYVTSGLLGILEKRLRDEQTADPDAVTECATKEEVPLCVDVAQALQSHFVPAGAAI